MYTQNMEYDRKIKQNRNKETCSVQIPWNFLLNLEEKLFSENDVISSDREARCTLTTQYVFGVLQMHFDPLPFFSTD